MLQRNEAKPFPDRRALLQRLLHVGHEVGEELLVRVGHVDIAVEGACKKNGYKIEVRKINQSQSILPRRNFTSSTFLNQNILITTYFREDEEGLSSKRRKREIVTIGAACSACQAAHEVDIEFNESPTRHFT